MGCYYADILSEEQNDRMLLVFTTCFIIYVMTSVLSRDPLLGWAEEAITGVQR